MIFCKTLTAADVLSKKMSCLNVLKIFGYLFLYNNQIEVKLLTTTYDLKNILLSNLLYTYLKKKRLDIKIS